MNCTSSSNNANIICNCDALQRATAALKNFDTLCRDTNMSEDKKDKFVRFCADVYGRQFLDDYAHIIKLHGHQIKKIKAEMINEYGLKACTLAGCTLYRRHRGREREEEQKEQELDLSVAFWMEQYDKLHYFLFHLFQTGKRIEMATDADELAKYQKY